MLSNQGNLVHALVTGKVRKGEDLLPEKGGRELREKQTELEARREILGRE